MEHSPPTINSSSLFPEPTDPPKRTPYMVIDEAVVVPGWVSPARLDALIVALREGRAHFEADNIVLDESTEEEGG